MTESSLLDSYSTLTGRTSWTCRDLMEIWVSHKKRETSSKYQISCKIVDFKTPVLQMFLTLPKISAKGPAGPVAPLTDARLAAEASAASRPLDSMVIFRSLPNGDFRLAPTALFCHGCSRVSSRKQKGEKTDLGASHLAFFGHLEQQLKHKISWYARATWATGVPCNLESALGMGMSAKPSVQRNCCHAIGYLQSCCLLPRSELWKSIGSLPHEHKLAIVGRPQMQLPIQYYSHMSFFPICSLNLSHLDLPLPLSNAENYPQMCSTNGNDGSWNVSWRISASKWNLLQLKCWKTYNPLMRPIEWAHHYQIAGLQHSQATASLGRYRACDAEVTHVEPSRFIPPTKKLQQ